MTHLCTLSVIVVGFERTFTSVVESSDSFELCVIFLTDSALLPTHTVINFSLNLLSVPGTAGIYTYNDFFFLLFHLLTSDSSDYDEFTSSNNPLMAFTSDPSTHRQCFNVNITDDEALEDMERFSLFLTLADGSNVPVVVDPDVSEVEIIDEDGVHALISDNRLLIIFLLSLQRFLLDLRQFLHLLMKAMIQLNCVFVSSLKLLYFQLTST